jgi:single-strand DNA-binding protein
MYSLNRATILGNVTRDPEVKQTASGQSVCSFGIATNRTWKDASGQKQEQVEFHNCVAWGKLADICGQYLKKGTKAYVEGRLQTREWEGQDGNKRKTTEIVTDNMIILDRAGAPAGGASKPFAPSMPKDDPSANPDDEIKVEDIPF